MVSLGNMQAVKQSGNWQMADMVGFTKMMTGSGGLQRVCLADHSCTTPRRNLKRLWLKRQRRYSVADNTWAYEIETRILGLLNSYAVPRIKKINGFEKTNFSNAVTNNESRLSGTIFPTIYVKELPAVEKERDLEGNTINSVLSTFQIDCIINTSQSQAKKMAQIISEIMKELQFEVTAMPSFNSKEKVYRSTARYRRTITKKDRLEIKPKAN
nr:MAG TPA: hypothetical protein [Caudoviricetes sp.]